MPFGSPLVVTCGRIIPRLCLASTECQEAPAAANHGVPHHRALGELSRELLRATKGDDGGGTPGVTGGYPQAEHSISSLPRLSTVTVGNFLFHSRGRGDWFRRQAGMPRQAPTVTTNPQHDYMPGGRTRSWVSPTAWDVIVGAPGPRDPWEHLGVSDRQVVTVR